MNLLSGSQLSAKVSTKQPEHCGAFKNLVKQSSSYNDQTPKTQNKADKIAHKQEANIENTHSVDTQSTHDKTPNQPTDSDRVNTDQVSQFHEDNIAQNNISYTDVVIEEEENGGSDIQSIGVECADDTDHVVEEQPSDEDSRIEDIDFIPVAVVQQSSLEISPKIVDVEEVEFIGSDEGRNLSHEENYVLTSDQNTDGKFALDIKDFEPVEQQNSLVNNQEQLQKKQAQFSSEGEMILGDAVVKQGVNTASAPQNLNAKTNVKSTDNKISDTVESVRIENEAPQPVVSDLKSETNQNFNFAHQNESAESLTENSDESASFVVKENETMSNASMISDRMQAVDTGAPDVDGIRDIHGVKGQITDAVDKLSSNPLGAKTMTITLNPGDLGKITVRLDIDANNITKISITATNRDTLDIIASSGNALLQDLQTVVKDISESSLSFNLQEGNQESGESKQNAQPQAALDNFDEENNGSIAHEKQDQYTMNPMIDGENTGVNRLI